MEIDLNEFLKRVSPAGTPIVLWAFQWSPEGDIFQYTDSGPVLMVHRNMVNIIQTEMAKKDRPGKSEDAPGQQNKPGKPGKPDKTKPVPAKTDPVKIEPVPEPPKVEPPVVTPPAPVEPVPAPEPEPLPVPVEPVRPPAPVEPPKVEPVPEPVDAPEPEPVRPAPEPIEVINTPRPKPTGKRIIGNIFPYLIKHSNDRGTAKFDFLADGIVNQNGLFYDYAAKPTPGVTQLFMQVPKLLNAKILKVNLGDAKGVSVNPVKINALLADGKLTRVDNYVPEFYGKSTDIMNSYAIPDRYSNVDLFEVLVPIKADGNQDSVFPSEWEIIAEHDEFYEQEPAIGLYKWEKTNGVVCYPWNFCNVSGRGLNDEMLAVADTFDEYRMYLERNDCYTAEGVFRTQPMAKGNWHLDAFVDWCFARGKVLILCLRGSERDPKFTQFVRDIATKYKGKVRIQLTNEINGHWRHDFMKPFECAEWHAKHYNLIKSIDPDMEVYSCGFALTQPNYLESMGLWSRLYNGGRRLFDVFCYHDYCKERAEEQRVSKGMGQAPEKTNYYKNGIRLNRTLHRLWPGVKFGKTETGYSHAVANPEQAVKAIGTRTRKQVMGDFIIRTKLEDMRMGSYVLALYQMYDDKGYITAVNALIAQGRTREQAEAEAKVNWDQANGVCNRNIDNKHKRDVASDYLYQMAQYLRGYEMTKPTDRTKPVWVDVLEREGAPKFYTAVIPDYIDAKIPNFKLNLPGVTSVTIIRPAKGDKAFEETRVINGELEFEVNESPAFVRVNK